MEKITFKFQTSFT